MPAIPPHRVGPQNSRPYAMDYQCLNIAQKHIQSRAPHNKYFEVPRNVSSIFTGREDICRDLQERCLPSDPPSAQKTQKRFVLHGLGGSGKTQICLKFAQDHRERYDSRYLIINNMAVSVRVSASRSILFCGTLRFAQVAYTPKAIQLFFHVTSEFVQCFQALPLTLSSFYGVFFIDASSASRAEQGFSAMAERCQVGKRMDDFKRWLTNLVEDWLLIIDNADDPSLDILQYFPTGCRGTVVVTTRNRDCAIHATVGSRDIGAMDFGEAISLLLKASGEQETETLRGRALPVVEILWSLALAIVQAGAVIRQKLFTFEEYCHAYSTRRKELHKFRSTQASSDYKFTVYTTWEVSRESIRAIANGVNATEEASQNATNALELLNFFGFCHFDDIWDEFFRLAWENMPEWSISGWWETNILQILRQDQRPEKWDPSRFRQAMSLLSSYSLIEWSEHRVSLHPLVHSWIRDSLNKPEQLRHWTSSVSTLAMMISTYKEQPYSLYKRLMPHVQSCLGVRDLRELLIEDGFAYVRASITYHLFTVYAQCFQPGEILLLTESAVEYTRKILGDEETLTWITVGNNAWAHNQLHQYQETIDKLSTRAEVFLSSPSLLTRPIACAIYRLISAYNNSQLTKQALKLGEKLVPLCIEDLGEKDEFTCGVIQELARSYSDIGRTNEAVELCESVVNRQKTFLSDKDDILLRSKYLLAVRYISTGRYHKAVDILRHVVKIRKKVFGDDNIDTLISQAELAKAYNNLGQPGTGIPLLVTAIGVGEKARLLNAGLQAWRITLARCQANEAKELWKNGTKPFRPEVVISLLVEAIQSGEKNGLLDAELQGWRRDLAAFQAHKADC